MLRQLPPVSDPNLLVGVDTADDAAVYKLNDRTALVQTVDFFPPVVDDAFSFGAIAAANAFSDVYAMGGRPLLALNIVGFPVDLPKEILGRILQGGGAKAQEAGVLVIGGHTVDDAEPKYGMAVTGTVEPGKQITNAGAKPGDALVITKPIGTGIITTAGKREQVSADVLDNAVAVMSALNQAASEAMVEVGVHACVDVTGFGLIGHLLGMLQREQCLGGSLIPECAALGTGRSDSQRTVLFPEARSETGRRPRPRWSGRLNCRNTRSCCCAMHRLPAGC